MGKETACICTLMEMLAYFEEHNIWTCLLLLLLNHLYSFSTVHFFSLLGAKNEL